MNDRNQSAAVHQDSTAAGQRELPSDFGSHFASGTLLKDRDIDRSTGQLTIGSAVQKKKRPSTTDLFHLLKTV